jgi:hypothetical protein
MSANASLHAIIELPNVIGGCISAITGLDPVICRGTAK